MSGRKREDSRSEYLSKWRSVRKNHNKDLTECFLEAQSKQNNELEDHTVTDIDSELMAKGEEEDVYANSGNDCSVQDSSISMECGVDNATEQTETAENQSSDTEWNFFLDQLSEGFEDNWSDSDTVEEKLEEEDSESNLSETLGLWASAHNITFVALSALLSLLRVHHPSLPKHPQTLLKTPRQVNIKTVEGGSYYHFGLVNCYTIKWGNFFFLS